MSSTGIHRHFYRVFLSLLLVACLLAVIFIVSSGTSAPLSDRRSARAAGVQLEGAVPPSDPEPGYPASTTSQVLTYLPFISRAPHVSLELVESWTGDMQGTQQTQYLPGAEIHYWVRGTNNFSTPTEVLLEWHLDGMCGQGLIFSGTVTIEPGEWEHVYPGFAPGCDGTYTSTVTVQYPGIIDSLSTNFTVFQVTGSLVVSSQAQGFDRCEPPSVAKMQAWWDSSPYQVTALYLGGIHYYCRDFIVDADWVRSVADQGWTFIPTWVGPQAPCSNYLHKISYNQDTAYQQGRGEADLASSAARDLGFLEELIIYYDMEGYPGDSASCRNAVNAFMQGWVERLHELNLKAGGYGGACSSNVADWNLNEPPPDDVWIAHWYLQSYSAGASAYNTPCVSDSLWVNRRIKQYTGGHGETWGGVYLTMDSDVLDGEVTLLGPEPVEAAGLYPGTITKIYGTPVEDIGLIDRGNGWAILEGSLYLTGDGGVHWDARMPAGMQVLGAQFLDPDHGWALMRSIEDGSLLFYSTRDGGLTWVDHAAPVGALWAGSVERAYIYPLDPDTIWLSIRLQSGTSFSEGKLYLTGDGGETWQERTIPLGEPVMFLDEQKGWVAGGPAGNQLYHTSDGGITWEEQRFELPEGGRWVVGLPYFISAHKGWLALGLEDGEKGRLLFYETLDGGNTWHFMAGFDVAGSLVSSTEMLSALAPLAAWEPADRDKFLASDALERGVVQLSIAEHPYAWVVAQSGSCMGDKSGVTSEPVRCEQTWEFRVTRDRGRSWVDLFLDFTGD